ncbi:MAG: hypothetical protein ACRD4O_15105 [Bryobacteraceae bacterium]
MRIEIKPWIFFPAIAIAVGCFAFFVHQSLHHAAISNEDLVRLLPRSADAVFFADFALLRRAGMLKLVSPAAKEDPEYKQFVHQTDFDYSKDIDALAGAATGRDLLFVIRGRFDWPSLRRYAASHNGYCKGQLCRVPASEPGRWASFRPLRSDVIALRLGPAVSPEPNSFLQGNEPIPHSPVWVELSPNILRNSARLPIGLRIFASALEPANSVTFSLTPAPAKSGNAFEVRLNAGCASSAAAASLASRLQLDTRLLKLELAREHRNAGPGSLAGLILSGQFHSAGVEAIGVWPVSQALLRSLE